MFCLAPVGEEGEKLTKRGEDQHADADTGGTVMNPTGVPRLMWRTPHAGRFLHGEHLMWPKLDGWKDRQIDTSRGWRDG